MFHVEPGTDKSRTKHYGNCGPPQGPLKGPLKSSLHTLRSTPTRPRGCYVQRSNYTPPIAPALPRRFCLQPAEVFAFKTLTPRLHILRPSHQWAPLDLHAPHRIATSGPKLTNESSLDQPKVANSPPCGASTCISPPSSTGESWSSLATRSRSRINNSRSPHSAGACPNRIDPTPGQKSAVAL